MQAYANLCSEEKRYDQIEPRISYESARTGLINLENNRERANTDNNKTPRLQFARIDNLLVGRERFELSTFCVSGRCPNQARRPAQSQLVEVRRC